MEVRFEKIQGIRLPDFAKDTEPLAKNVSLYALSKIQKRLESNISPANAELTVAIKKGSNTLKDEGRLRGSLHARYSKHSAAVATNVSYARILNDGGTIMPVKAKRLAIPARRDIARFTRQYKSVREAVDALKGKGYLIFRPKKKNSKERSNVIMAQKGNRGKPFTAYILVKSITIPKREFMILSDAEIANIDKMVEAYYEK